MKRFHLTLLLVLVAALAVAGCTQQSNPNPILPSGDTNQSDNNAAAPGPNPITDIPSKGGLTVTVTDPDGALIANAVVEVFADAAAYRDRDGNERTALNPASMSPERLALTVRDLRSRLADEQRAAEARRVKAVTLQREQQRRAGA